MSRRSYLWWVRYRCPHRRRNGDRCILTIWDDAHHDYGDWIEHHPSVA